jgi:hypothetical protein
LGHGAIALSSNDKSKSELEALPALQHRQTPTCSLSSTKTRFLLLFSRRIMVQTSVYFRHQKALPMTKIRISAAPFASLNCLSSPSELRKSDFEVGRQTSTSANEKASFRQRARVLGREGFQTSRTDFSGLHVAWSADHSSEDIIPSFILLPDEQRRPFLSTSRMCLSELTRSCLEILGNAIMPF